MKNKTVIILDCDGTILDSFSTAQKIMKELAGPEKFNVPLPNDNDIEFKMIWGRGGYNMIKRCFPGCDHEEVHREWKKLEKNMEIKLIEGTEKTVKKLKERGYIVGLVTNRSWKSLKQYKKLWKPLNFDFIQTSEYKKSHRILRALNPFKSKKCLKTKYFKPNPKAFKPFIKFLKKQKIAPEKIICVDDSLVGFEAVFWINLSVKPRIEFIGVLTGPIKTKEEWYQIVKTAKINKEFPVIPSIADLLDWLKNNKIIK